jgi:hypothetical protein
MRIIPEDAVVVFVGARRTGKSQIIKNLLYYHRDIPIGTIISGTEVANGFFEKIVPKVFIHHECTPELIDNVLNRQKKLKKKVKKIERKTKESSNIDTRAVLLLDDCLYDDNWIRKKNIRELFMNGRHWDVMFLITMQYPLGIPPNLRSNVDYVFILRENKQSNRQRIYQNYASIFPSFEMFNTVMDSCTENYECLVIAANSQSNKLQDQVFWYKADINCGNFKFGAKEFWENNDADDSSDEDDDELFDISQYQKKKMHLSINKKH